MKAITLKPVHLRKLTAITEVKGKALFSKNFIIMPIFSIGFTFLMDLIYRNVMSSVSDKFSMSAYALAIGTLMNISMMGIYVAAAALAEEKEKNTLRTLMTSSVNGLEFFLGSLIPVVLMIIAVNVICVFIIRLPMTPFQWAGYLTVTTVSAVIATVVGMIFGIFAKNQVSASTITTPGILILMMVPMFSGLNETLEKISRCFFTGITFDLVANIKSRGALIDPRGILILTAELILSIVLFLFLYRKNGFER